MIDKLGVWITVRWLWCIDFLCGADGKPSNPKMMGWALYLAFVLNRPIPGTVCALLLAAAFGLKTFQMWLQKSTFAVTHADTVAITWEKKVQEIIQRRDPTTGVEPTA